MNIQETAHLYLKTFISNFPDVKKAMENTNHHLPDQCPNYHLGESVWTHTLMVYSHVIEMLKNYHDSYEFEKKCLLLAALLHDVGKPDAIKFKEGADKVVFYGHDSYSTFIANDILRSYNLSQKEITTILRLINHHQLLFDFTNKNDKITDKAINKLTDKLANYESITYNLNFYNMLYILREADFKGNISNTHSYISNNVSLKIVNGIKEKSALLSINRELNLTLPICYVMVGLPRSGKSTYIETKFKGKEVLSRDNIVMELSPNLTYNEAFKSVDQSLVDSIYEKRFTELINRKEDFVIDKTNLSYNGRLKIRNKVKNKFNVKLVVMLPTMEEIRKRNNVEGKIISNEVYKKMMLTFNFPFDSESDHPIEFNL